MPPVNMSVEHGQTWEVARSNFEKGIEAARTRFAVWIRRVDWSDDRTSARLSGPGYTLELSVDPREVHARGHLPIFASFLEAPVKAFLKKTFEKPIPP
jgi:hypothetical protein